MQDVWEDRRSVKWDEGTTSVVSVDGLVKMKIMAGRKRDLEDIEKLREAANES